MNVMTNNDKTKPRLFLVSNMYPSAKGVRYGIFVKRFEEALINDFNVKRIVLTIKDNVISKLLGYMFLYLKVLNLFFITKRSDTVYVHFPLYFSFALFPLTWRKIPIVINFHGSDAVFNTPQKKFFRLFMGPVMANAVKIVVPSDYYKEMIMKIFKVGDIERMYVYPSGGINAKIFYPIEEGGDEKLTFGFVSNFIETKGWRIFLNALSKIAVSEKDQNVKGIMVGDGPDRSKIIKIIDESGLDIELIPNVPQEELAHIYSRFSAFIFPTYRDEESLGLVGLEAMMCGIPVIASNIGGPAGYVKEGHNGFLFQKQNIEELVEKIKCFQSLKIEEVKKMKMNCIGTAKNYDCQVVNSALIRFLKSIH
ncbi:glycosyltransferase family 4 protein [Allomuricauda sp. M10]|uniref:glycosyltransferase family 4 protein n=1 Tax=Allomuricauda sp. M10 TaxID=2683292 RepID=UPI001D197357|nr:glycosyltransferase family 4 protein [Muricauda sp. M10]